MTAEPAVPKLLHHSSSTNSKTDEMVASLFAPSASGTPPQSPHRGGGRTSFSVTSHFMIPSPNKKSPKTSGSGTKSPTNSGSRRASYHTVSPTHSGTTTTGSAHIAVGLDHSSSHHNNPSNTGPISSRPQPATAPAPVVGHHAKNSSLVGFDPLLNAALISSPPRTSINSNNNDTLAALKDMSGRQQQQPLQQQQQQGPPPLTPTTSKDRGIPASLSNLTVSPPKSPAAAKVGPEPDLSQELRKLAKDLSAASPQRGNQRAKVEAPTSAKSGLSKPKFGRASSLTPKFNLTPPFRSSLLDKSSSHNNNTTTSTASNSNSAGGSGPLKEPLSAPHRKLPWQRHRRSKSLETPNDVLTEVVPARVESFENDSRKANTPATAEAGGFVPSSPMMKDLYDVVKAQQAKQESIATASLALPSLAKPAPTSFLTGTEIVRSSEQDPSPFQMEIPSLDQTLVAARLAQWVETYRKEDMNFDVAASLIGLPRMAMRSFVSSADAQPPNNSLTQAHKPIVEWLLEAAEDVTVAGFFATAGAGSADTRREVVIFERQMQFVVVFRGTSTEQAAKTSYFKNKAKNFLDNKKDQHALEALSTEDNASQCKVYGSVKQAYMELERSVFGCLDRALDQNPFCDVVFTGSSLGGGMATLAAYRYASNRPVVRVSCQTFGSPRVGNKGFRQQVNSLPNLKVMRMEYSTDPKCFAPYDSQGSHVGHSIVLCKQDNGGKTVTAVAKKFYDNSCDNLKVHASKVASSALFATFKKERDINSYVSHLEQLNQSKTSKWMKDFKGEDGTGVRGKDNEQRQMV